MSQSLAQRRKLFLKIFRLAEKKYGPSSKRLAAEGWNTDWKLLIATMLSAQSRDEVTIRLAEKLFKKYPTLQKLSGATEKGIATQIRSMNYYKTKAKNIRLTAKMLIKDFNSRVPETLEDLTKLPGVGRKTANLIIGELHKGDAICIDTHCHRLANVLDWVNTKTRHQTEIELEKVVPKRYWNKINRILVLWGQDVRGWGRKKILDKLKEESK